MRFKNVSRCCVAWLAGWVGVGVVSVGALCAAEKPNVVIILADDMGYADCGAYGCKDIPTPQIDSLARNGVRFSSGYVSGPYCSPTRAALMSGRYQQRYGCEYLTTYFGTPGLSLKETTVAQRLKQTGYVTGIVGKWHLGNAEGYHPLDRGFDEFFGFLGGGHHYLPSTKDEDGEYHAAILRGRERVKESEYLTDAFGREASAFVTRHKQEPFFLYLAFNAVHTPLEATPKYRDRFSNLTATPRNIYAAMLSAMDDNIGRLLQALRESGLEEKTLIFFLSDNGGPITHNAPNGSQNTPLRGGKAETWEGGIRVPFIAQWKGVLKPGTTYERPVIQMDITATAMSVGGLELKPDWQLDGVNLMPYLLGQQTGDPHESLCWRLGGLMAIRSGDWKLITPYTGQPSMGPQPAGFDPFTGAQLFNLARDIGEQQPVDAEHPQVVADLKSKWHDWASQMPVLTKEESVKRKPAKTPKH